MLYRIKPLEWEEAGHGSWWASSVLGPIGVYPGGLNLPWERIHPTYLGTLADGKADAEARYRERLQAALEPVPNEAAHDQA
jgi:hypothetical protein